MNYPNYTGFGNGYYQQYNQQNFMQKPVQQSDLVFNQIRYLEEDQIKSYIPMIGEKSMLIDRTNCVVSIVSCDSNGNTSRDMFSFSRYEPKTKSSTEILNKDIDFSEFVKKEDLNTYFKAEDFKKFSDEFSSRFDKLEKKIKISEIMNEENK